MQTGSAFLSTQWSLVLAAPDDPTILDALLRRYVGPIYAYIRRSGNGRDQAADLTQEFIAQVILERGLLDRADPDRGRFRTFLKASLANFLIDQHRRATARTRSAEAPALTGLSLDQLEPSETDDISSAFDRQWAATILSAALTQLEADCKACNQGTHWSLFSAAVLEPALHHTSPPPHEQLGARVGIADPGQVASMIQTVRRKFRRILLQVVQETISDPGHAEEEIRSLREFLRL